MDFINCKLEKFKSDIVKKKVAVLGLGISNFPLVRYLAALGADITAFDRQDKEKLWNIMDELRDYGIKYSLGENYLKKLEGFDIIFKTPIVRNDIPELMRAKDSGAEITSEMEVFLKLCPAKTFGVTGSDGKTTTTTLIYNMLMEEGYHCWLGGNIGTPLIEKIDRIKPDDMAVIELSSFQLHSMSVSPDVAVITNISPNHLDVHKDYHEYIEAKKNIYRYAENNIRLVLNYDNNETAKIFNEGKSSKDKTETIIFSRKSFDNTISPFVYLENDIICVYEKEKSVDQEFFNKNEILITGEHNLENYLAAISAVYQYVCPKTALKVAREFKGVAHRNEFVRCVSGINFYNDSIASSPTRAVATLNSFCGKVILIAGGKDKKISYEKIGKTIHEKVKALFLIGDTKNAIKKSYLDFMKENKIQKTIHICECETYEEVVEKAYMIASSGDNIVLSPASTSFDRFKNFEERGNLYKKLVKGLQDKV